MVCLAACIQVPARGMVSVGVEYCGRFLHESQCTLIAVTNTIGIKQQVHTFVLKGSMKTLKTHVSFPECTMAMLCLMPLVLVLL